MGGRGISLLLNFSKMITVRKVFLSALKDLQTDGKAIYSIDGAVVHGS